MPLNLCAVELLFRMNRADTAALATELFQSSVRLYNSTVNAQLEALGKPASFRLTNGQELKRLKAQAIQAAASIADTYNKDLAKKVDAVVAAEGRLGLNRRTLAKRLADWDASRSEWKTRAIASAEGPRVRLRAVQAWAEASGIENEVRYRLSPGESAHDDLNDQWAREGRLLTRSELEFSGLPAHPGERHSPHLAFPAEVDVSALWDGA
jgi:uncharacterized tellurite resistance protein B-like protein